jgi:outer membrane protein insertion porin family
MQVESTQVSITPDRKDIYITVNITEGDKFTVSDVKLAGEMFGREEELQSLISLKSGDVYSGEKLSESVKRISDRMGNFGYAFANVNANPDINREKKEVAFTVFVDPGKRVYVRNINISGNTKTRDEVIRREFRQFERSWYDGEKIKLSRDRVDRLGYFTEVGIQTPEVPGTNDQVDLNMNVTEKPTGNISLGAGFSSSEKLILSGSLNQENAFGSGNSIGIDVNTSKRYRTISFSHTNPYFTDDGVSRTYEIFTRTTRPPRVSTGEYRIVSTGGRISFGVPFTEVDRVFFGAGVERTKVETEENSPERFKEYVRDFTDIDSGVGSATTTTFPLTAQWQRDSRDSALVPTTGRLQRAKLEVGLGNDTNYYIGTLQQQYYKPMFGGGITMALNGQIDYGREFGGKPYPVFKNFYAGGIGTVRGYEGYSLAVTPIGNNDPVGGQSRLILNAELQFPFPGSGNDRSLRWFTFVDGGNVFTRDEKIGISDLRYAAGVGISWISPIGPLKLSFGKPLNSKEGDREQSFQFQLGTGF